MDSDELPNDGKDKFFVPVTDILGTDSNKGNLQLGGRVKSDLAVDAFLECVVGVFLNTVPLDNCRVDSVDDFKQKLAISSFFKNIVHK